MLGSSWVAVQLQEATSLQELVRQSVSSYIIASYRVMENEPLLQRIQKETVVANGGIILNLFEMTEGNTKNLRTVEDAQADIQTESL
jgi:hypothetical protein